MGVYSIDFVRPPWNMLVGVDSIAFESERMDSIAFESDHNGVCWWEWILLILSQKEWILFRV